MFCLGFVICVLEFCNQIYKMTIYDITFFIFSIIYLPYLAIKGKAHRDFTQRLGSLPEDLKKIGPKRPVWIHAVSVGEVLTVKNFIDKFLKEYPERKIVLSTTTRTGNEIAKKVIDNRVSRFYFPLDFTWVVRRVTNFINPLAFVIVETEIWPNLIIELSKRNVPIALINGRISEKSFAGYKKIKFLFGAILKKINLFCMRTKSDAERIKALGAREENVRITGNMKFDTELSGRDNPATGIKRSDLGLSQSDMLIVAGSTHNGEEKMLLDIYKRLAEKFEKLRIVIAPRHIDRARNIKKLAEEMGYEGILLSSFKEKENRISKNSIFILDTLGELKSLYSLATVVFMGGSLIKRGGHNIIEPATFGKPVVFGHYMFNFQDTARSFLEGGAAVEVRDKEELLGTLDALLGDEKKRTNLGRNAMELLEKSKGATETNISQIKSLI